MCRVNDPCQDINQVVKSLSFVQFPTSLQQKPLPKLSPVVLQTQCIPNLMSSIKMQDVPPLFHFAFCYIYQHDREDTANDYFRGQFYFPSFLKAKSSIVIYFLVKQFLDFI